MCSALSLCLGVINLVAYFATSSFELRYDDKCPSGTCKLIMDIDKSLSGTVKLQYKLTKFHQNHRRLSYSRVYDQLIGKYVDFDGLERAKPYRSVNESRDPNDWILPSGALAYLAFNDTIKWTNTAQKFNEDAIVYNEEKSYLFQPLNAKYTTGNKWIEGNSAFPGGMTDPHFITWMRVSASSTVIKDWAICHNCDIPEGKYEVTVTANYPKELFGGEKYIVISGTTVLGDRSALLPLGLLGFGVILFLLALIMTLSELCCPRPLGNSGKIFTE